MIGARKKSRQPRQLISQEKDDEDDTVDLSESAVRRPLALAKKSSSSRLSFGVSPDVSKSSTRQED